jgi:hypothetical protein
MAGGKLRERSLDSGLGPSSPAAFGDAEGVASRDCWHFARKYQGAAGESSDHGQGGRAVRRAVRPHRAWWPFFAIVGVAAWGASPGHSRKIAAPQSGSPWCVPPFVRRAGRARLSASQRRAGEPRIRGTAGDRGCWASKSRWDAPAAGLDRVAAGDDHGRVRLRGGAPKGRETSQSPITGARLKHGTTGRTATARRRRCSRA